VSKAPTTHYSRHRSQATTQTTQPPNHPTTRQQPEPPKTEARDKMTAAAGPQSSG